MPRNVDGEGIQSLTRLERRRIVTTPKLPPTIVRLRFVEHPHLLVVHESHVDAD